MAVGPADLAERTLAYYRDRFARHGSTPLGVDWNGAQSQRRQFEQLLKLLPAPEPAGAASSIDFSLNDFGCGYGALADLLLERYPAVVYHGVDLNAEMIAAARERHPNRPQVSFDVADRPLETADYGVAAGVFTLRLGRSDAQCLADMTQSLDALDQTSSHGFAFNALTSYSDADKMKDHLYYPDPCRLFDWCKRRYSREVALLHDYGLYAFTVLVRKRLPPWRRENDREPAAVMHRWTGYACIAATIAFSAYGQLVLKWRMDLLGPLPAGPAGALRHLLAALLDWGVLSSFVAAFAASLAWMAAMTRFELSFAYPFMSLNFVLVLGFGVALLGERLTVGKAVGVALIVVGTVLASLDTA